MLTLRQYGSGFGPTDSPRSAYNSFALRAFGRPLDRFAAVPRNLLQYVCEAFSAPLLSIASLKTLYQRRPTLYEHQQWVKEHLGIKPFDVTSQAALLEMLRVQAAAAADVDELVTTAQRWLYNRCRLIPGQRQITDMARHAFSAYEAQMLAAVNRAVPAATLQHCMESVRSPGADGSATHLEWIKAPSRRNGPKNLAGNAGQDPLPEVPRCARVES